MAAAATSCPCRIDNIVVAKGKGCFLIIGASFGLRDPGEVAGESPGRELDSALEVADGIAGE